MAALLCLIVVMLQSLLSIIRTIKNPENWVQSVTSWLYRQTAKIRHIPRYEDILTYDCPLGTLLVWLPSVEGQLIQDCRCAHITTLPPSPHTGSTPLLDPKRTPLLDSQSEGPTPPQQTPPPPEEKIGDRSRTFLWLSVNKKDIYCLMSVINWRSMEDRGSRRSAVTLNKKCDKMSQ